MNAKKLLIGTFLLALFLLILAIGDAGPLQAASSLVPPPLPSVTDSNASSNADCTTLVTEDIQTSTTWTLAGSPYCIDTWYWIDVYSATTPITLTIEAGVVVKGEEWRMWNMCGPSTLAIGENAALQILGTADHPVVFTPRYAGNEDEEWGRVILQSSSRVTDTVIQHAIFEHGGARYYNPGGDCAYHVGEMLEINGGSPIVRDSIFRFSDVDGIQVYGGAPTIANTQVISSGGTGIRLDAGDALVDNCQVIGSGGDGIYVGADSPTIRRTQVTGSYYNGVNIGSGSPTIEQAVVSGGSMYFSNGIRIDGGSPTITGTQAANNGGDGIWVLSGDPTISHSQVLNNSDDGIQIDTPGPGVVITQTRLVGNGDYGMVTGNPSICVDARGLDWGDFTGPLDNSNASDCALLYNPGGKGDRVSDGIIYSGWVGGPEQLSTNVWSPRRISPGQEVTYLAQFYNGLGEVADDAVLVIYLPREFYHKQSTSGGIYRQDGGRHEVFWKLGDLNPGESGRVAVTVEVPWGLPNHTGVLVANIGARNAQTGRPLDIDEYMSYVPVLPTAQQVLTPSEISALLAADAALDALHDHALSLGYTFNNDVVQMAMSDGSTLVVFAMFDPVGGAPVMLIRSGSRMFLQRSTGVEISYFDQYGGMSFDLATGGLDIWGAWAEAHSPSFGLCMANCLPISVPKAVLEEVSKIFDVLSNAKDCYDCATTRSYLSCAGCTVGIMEKLMAVSVGWWGNAIFAVAECVPECKADPEKYWCWNDKFICAGKYGNDLGFWRLPCDKGTGFYNYWGRELIQYCAHNEICHPQDGCIKFMECAKFDIPQNMSSSSCSVASPATSAQGACFAYDVATAHDPNAKSAQPLGYVVPGQQLDYTVEYENTGTGTAYNVFVLDKLDENLNESTLVIGGGGQYNSGSRTLSWDIGTLAPGEQGQVTFSVNVKNGLSSGTEIVNQAEVHFPSALEILSTNPVVHIVRDIAAYPQSLETTAGTPLPITLTGQDAGGASLSYKLKGGPSFGELTGTPPNVTYTSSSDYDGLDSFDFVVDNGSVESDPATVRILVHPSPSDVTPPTVIKTYPAPSQQDVRVITNAISSTAYPPAISATFSEPVDPATVGSSTFTVSGITGTVVYDVGTRTATFYPGSPLQTSTTYVATVTTGVQDNSGNPMASAHSWSFATVDDVAIQVSLPAMTDTLDCGSVAVGSSDYQIVSVVSIGLADLTLGTLSRAGADSAEFTIANDTCSGQTLGPNETCTARVVFAPNSEGEKTATLSIPSNDPDTPVVTVPLRGDGESGAARVYLPLVARDYAPPQVGWVTLIDETFEGDFPGDWRLVDTSPDGKEYLWAKTNCRAYAGQYSAWGVGGGRDGLTLPCFSWYPSNVDSSMIYGPFSLADATAGDLEFRLWMNSEYTAEKYDYLFRGFSINGTTFYGQRTAGNSQGAWITRTLDLTDIPTLGDITGQSQVWFALAFVSDGDTNAPEGAHVDDILLRKYVPASGAAATAPSSRQAHTDVGTLHESPARLTLDGGFSAALYRSLFTGRRYSPD